MPSTSPMSAPGSVDNTTSLAGPRHHIPRRRTPEWTFLPCLADKRLDQPEPAYRITQPSTPLFSRILQRAVHQPAFRLTLEHPDHGDNSVDGSSW